MKKAFDQTVRDLKREVNKKVLKIPGIELKVRDATSNEAWGPHGSLLADIAQATKNYQDYLIIMTILWKRINDTGKNWRHVYKTLIVLEYLVANGSERVIDEIRERAYQISTLSSFQYIDSKGRDQGNNVRRRSQTLVALVNDKERIVEAREKAVANRHKFRQMSSFGGIYRSSSYTNSAGYGNRYDDDHYDGQYKTRDEDRSGYGYGRERGWGYMSDDRYGRGGDFDRRDVEQVDKYVNRNDGYRGRTTRSLANYKYGSRSKSFERMHAFDDDYQGSSRSSDTKVEDCYQEGTQGRRLHRKFSEQFLDRKFSERNLGTPPSNEDAASASRSPVCSERDSYNSMDSIPGASSKPANNNLVREMNASASQEFEVSDEFDPRGSVSGSASQTTLSAPNAMNESFEDPFGDGPFKAVPSTTAIPIQPNTDSVHPGVQELDITSNDDTWNSLLAITYHPSSPSNVQSSISSSDIVSQELYTQQNTDILAGILPPTGSSHSTISQEAFPTPLGGGFYSSETYVRPFSQQTNAQFPTGPATHLNGNFLPQSTSTAPINVNSQIPPRSPSSANTNNFLPQRGSIGHSSVGSQMQSYPSFRVATRSNSEELPPLQGSSTPNASNTGSGVHSGNNFLYNFPQGRAGSVIPHQNVSASTATHVDSQLFNEKFQTKSTVWSDTLSRGLVNLNISGPKINPLAEIGIDFDALNRKERMEKPVTTSAAMSTTTMGKAMGSGTGIGCAGGNTLMPSTGPLVNPDMGIGGRPNVGMGIAGGYGNIHQQHMGAGIAQGSWMQHPAASSPRGNMSGGYTQQSNGTNYR